MEKQKLNSIVSWFALGLAAVALFVAFKRPMRPHFRGPGGSHMAHKQPPPPEQPK